MKRKYLIQAWLFQIFHKHAFKNIFITKNALGIMSINSHIRHFNGKEKVVYNSRKVAKKCAEALSKEKGLDFDYYKCAYCKGYHIGKNKV